MLEPLQSIPRFLSFIELTHLYEAAKAADEHLASKLPSGDTQADINMRSYINSTRQSLLRAIFLSSYGVIEQNMMLPPYSSPRPSRNKPPGSLMAPAALVRPAAS